jgi:tetratricopeptide (TPR) repeat protein
LADGFGYSDYHNPYYLEGQTIESAEPVVTLPVEEPVAAADQPASALPPGVSREAIDKFDQARVAFLEGRYEEALKLTEAAIAQMPHDAVLHEFRSLVLFALRRYAESAAAIHAVLAVGPGWDAKTLTSLYPDMATYTNHLRALEGYRDSNLKAPELHFLVGYHYLTCGYPVEAASEFRRATELRPKDAVAASLAATLSPHDMPETTSPNEQAAPKAIAADQVAGSWTATAAKGAKYSMDLQTAGAFTWGFMRGSKNENVNGVYTMEGNVLAMEPDTGGILLAELTFKGSDTLLFRMIGGAKDDPGLEFQRVPAK